MAIAILVEQWNNVGSTLDYLVAGNRPSNTDVIRLNE